MFGILKKAVLAGLGLQARANEIVDEWIEKGKGNQRKEAVKIKTFLDRLEQDAQSLERTAGELCGKVLSFADLASREEMNKLSKKVDDLSNRFERTQKAAR